MSMPQVVGRVVGVVARIDDPPINQPHHVSPDLLIHDYRKNRNPSKIITNECFLRYDRPLPSLHPPPP